MLMQAHCVLDIVSQAESPSSDSSNAHSALGARTALSVNVRVTPGMQPAADLIDLAWQGVQNHSGSRRPGIYVQCRCTFLCMVTVFGCVCLCVCVCVKRAAVSSQRTSVRLLKQSCSPACSRYTIAIVLLCHV